MNVRIVGTGGPMRLGGRGEPRAIMNFKFIIALGLGSYHSIASI
jgi:hypothetical protein